MKGRKPKPIAVKRLQGNPGKRPLNEGGTPKPPIPESTPYVPRHLNEHAKKEWRRVVKILMEIGLYTEVDRAALAMYCQAWGRWVEAEEMLVETGGEILASEETGNFYQNPWYHVANKAWEQMRKVLAEFGLSPSSRSRLQVEQEARQMSLAEALFGMIEDA